MTTPYRDDEAALRERRTALVEERSRELADADRIAAVLADRSARFAASICALVPLGIFQVLLATSPPSLATPVGATALARALIIGSALLSLVVYILVHGLTLLSARELHTRIAETGDVHADVERLRVPIDVAPLTRRATRLEAWALAVPIFALCAPAILLVVYARIEALGAHPLRTYVLEPGLVSRRMGDVEAIANALVGSAVLVQLSWLAFGIAAWHFVSQQLFGSAKTHPATTASFFGGVLLGAELAQAITNGLEESGEAVVLGYLGIAIGIAVGVLGARAVFAWARRTFARERETLASIRT